MLKIYAVRDVKADAFGALIGCPTKGLAIRAFSDACADGNSPMARCPEDYSLYELGSYDPSSGLLTPHRLPELVVSASSIVEQLKLARSKSVEVSS